jgi:hypothetical protein
MALLGHVETRFYSQSISASSVIRTKTALLALCADEKWDEMAGSMTREGREAAAAVKKLVMSADWWRKLEALVLFLRPLVQLQGNCGSDRCMLTATFEAC